MNTGSKTESGKPLKEDINETEKWDPEKDKSGTDNDVSVCKN
jgi:hypothetical protein